MKTIFVIGNGFDLAHGLKTSYGHFMDSIDDDKINNNDLLFILKHVKNKGNWSDIEYLYFTLLKKCDDIEGYLKDNFGILVDEYSSQHLDNNFNEIKLLLEEYLFSEQKNLKLIDTYSNLFEEFNDSDTLILDFNYTNTISEYLQKFNSNIQHIKIHGELLKTHNPIVFGYAANDEEAKYLTDKNDEYLMKNIKKLRYLLADNESRFKAMLETSLSKIDVYILGHSCGLSDRLILNELFTHINVEKITQLYYNNMDEFLKTVINIDRVIDDYIVSDKTTRSFQKLKNYSFSKAMIQHDCSQNDIDSFKYYIKVMKGIHNLKNSYMISSFS